MLHHDSASPRFRVEQIIAGGTFGTVCLVLDRALGEKRAAKVLRSEHLQNPRIVSRVRDEAALLARLVHPNVVRVHELLEVAGRPVTVMEWVPGINLEELIAQRHRGLEPADALELVRQTASALHAAYGRPQFPGGPALRVIHRDIKPSNLILSRSGALKVVDFGTAQGRFAGRLSETISMVLGARGYLAPERLDGGDDRPEGDVYALGHVLYELLTGAAMQLSLHPFHHERILRAHLDDLPGGLPAQAAHQIHTLIYEMCSYEAESRPTQAQVTMRLTRVMATHDLRPDLARLAREVVAPACDQRATLEPQQHPSWPEVAFLEASKGNAPPVDERIRAFLKRSDWLDKIQQLRVLLTLDPTWTATPFLEVLRQAAPPWWRFWRRRRLDPEQIAVLLETLQSRPTHRVRQEARAFARHPDPQVQYRAQNLLKAPTPPT